MKKIFKLLLCILMFISIALMGCRDKGYDISGDPDNDEGFKFEDYNYDTVDREYPHARDLPVDEGFAIDGNLNETAYQSLKPFTLTDEGQLYRLDTRLYFGESGLYIAAEMTDPDLYYVYSDDRPIYQNSSVIFTLDTLLPGNTLPSLTVNTIQIRVGINGQIEQLCGRGFGGYEYSGVYFPVMARTMVVKNDSSLQDVDFLKAYKAEGVKGYNIEIYLPWKSLNVESAPEHVLVRPEFNKVFDMLADGSGGRINVGHRSHIDPEQFVPFGHSEPSNDFFMPSDTTWNIGSDGIISQSNGGDRKMFAKDSDGNLIKSSKYYFETKVSINKKLDEWPKLGIVAGQISNNTYFYTIDAEKDMTNNLFLAVNCAKGTDDWLWPGRGDNVKAELGRVDSLPSYKDGNYVKMAVMRDGEYWYFFVQDQLISKRKDIRGFDANVESYFGIMTMNTDAKFKDIYHCVGDDAEVKLNSLISTLVVPSKTQYRVGDAIDLSGGKIVRRDFDNFSETLVTLTNANKEQYNIQGFDTTTAGTKTVSLTVNGVQYSYNITVS